MKKKKFVIIDGHALIHRAWHAIPPLTTKDGRVVNAAFGFTSILLKAINDLKPDFMAVTFDLKGPTFRHKQYKEYKAHRVTESDELYIQIPWIKEIVESFNIKIFEKQGFEADDVIGTLCEKKQVDRDDVLSIIVTGDMDTMQLVDGNTHVFTLKRGMSETVMYDRKAVIEKYNGLTPEQMIDYKALRGDPSDNIPGVKGIGEKTATALLTDFKTLDNLYKEVESNSVTVRAKIKERIIKLLIDDKDNAYMSKELATIKRDVPIDFNLDDCAMRPYNKERVLELFTDLEFRGLFDRLPKIESMNDVPGISKDENVQYELIDAPKKFEVFLDKLKQQEIFCFDTETTGLDVMDADLLGISFSWKAGEAYYVMANKPWLAELQQIFENEKVKKVAQNMKYDASILKAHGIEMAGFFFDTMVASYVLDSSSRSHGLDHLALVEFEHQMIPITDLIGSGRDKISMAEVPVETLSFYSCEDADYTWQLYEVFAPRLEKEGLQKLFEEIEMPLIKILMEMEFNGIKLDVPFLKGLEKKVKRKITLLEKKIHEYAGTDFNISSPKQLKEVLFEKLDISAMGLKKTKTGISTAASELEKLKDAHPIIPLISDYRELTKLQSTYIVALPKLVRKDTGRLHTSFNQTVTSTGRLSSSNPNLQNIPIRTELGQEIRKAFIADRGNRLISSDYSQVELRVIACLAKDQHMIDVFKKGEDIHKATASKIFDVSLDEVTKDQRRKAKEVNFGVLYGMGANALAQRTGITRSEAKAFIDKYFENYKAVKLYIEKMVEEVRDKGYVATLFGRRRNFPEINSSIPPIRAAAERMAVNMPIQGTAADLMKLAMIAVYRELKKVSPESRLLLQVHDELVIECPKDELEKVAKVVDEKMEKIHKLAVPIKAETEVGKNWDQMTVIA